MIAGYVVLYTEAGVVGSSSVFTRFDSTTESNAKTFAIECLSKGRTGVYICEVVMKHKVEASYTMRELP